MRKVDACVDGVTVPVVVDDDVSLDIRYKLIATVNHTGILSRGHYSAFVKDPASGGWWLCNDRAVTPARSQDLNSTTSYLFFFQRCDVQ